MIRTLFRHSTKVGILASFVTVFLALAAAMMASIIVLFCFPVIGETVAGWVGHSYFAVLIQLLY